MSATRRGLLLVCLFAAALLVPFYGKAFTIDEPFFLAIARQILRDPLHPMSFEWDWAGRLIPVSEVNNTPLLFPYLLAAALRLFGESEWRLRLFFLPFDLAAAAGLYLLAARFLKRPLIPTLLVLASPGYGVNMAHLMGEKLAFACGVWGLYALVRGVDERRRDWYWASTGLLATALLSKYVALLFLPPAALYAWRRRVSLPLVFGHLAVTLAPVALCLLADAWTGPSILPALWSHTAKSAGAIWSRWPHRLRSFLSFTGGCALPALLWPSLLGGLGIAPAALGAAALIALFSPALDVIRAASALDRATGLVFSSTALLALGSLFAAARGRRGWPLWSAWALAAGALQLGVYWAVMTRLIIFLVPPLLFGLAEELEARGVRRPAWDRALLALSLSVALGLAAVDYRFAEAPRRFAREVVAPLVAGGQRVWFTGQWGLRYYLERAGAASLDESSGGWAQMRPGDRIALSQVSPMLDPPEQPLLAERAIPVESLIPLRLMSRWDRNAYGPYHQGGYYASCWGFLPYAFSRDFVDTLVIATPASFAPPRRRP